MTATVHNISEKRSPSLDPMIALTAADMNAVNAVILERMQSNVALIPELAGHLIAGRGKRMRPMLTLASAALLDYPGARHRPCSHAHTRPPSFACAQRRSLFHSSESDSSPGSVSRSCSAAFTRACFC